MKIKDYELALDVIGDCRKEGRWSVAQLYLQTYKKLLTCDTDILPPDKKTLMDKFSESEFQSEISKTLDEID